MPLSTIIEISSASYLQSELPSAVKGGEFILIKGSEIKGHHVFIGRDELTPVTNHDQFIGAASLYSHSYSQVWGWKKVKDSVFAPPAFEWWGHWMQVKKAPLATASQLRIPSSIWEKVSSDEELIQEQREKSTQVLKRRDTPLESLCFRSPIKSVVTSKFASPRTLPNGNSYYHTGLDLRAATGTPIMASGAGEVVLAEPLIVPGQTVLLYHGGGLFSAYKHLSEIKVKPGDRIPAGAVVGLSGATGRVEAPHLHFEFFWKGHPTDPQALLKLSEQTCGRE